MDVWRGIWYSNFSACKEIHCLEEQTDHRTTFPLDKPGSWEAKTFGKLVGKLGGNETFGEKLQMWVSSKANTSTTCKVFCKNICRCLQGCFALIISTSWQPGGVTWGLVSESLAAIDVAVALSLPLPLRHMRSSCLRMANLQLPQYYSCPKTNNTNCKNCDRVESWCPL